MLVFLLAELLYEEAFRVSSARGAGGGGTVGRTQLRLKQSCEQKQDTMPCFRHFGHWRVLVGLLHDKPIHIRTAADILNLFVGKEEIY